MSSYKYKKGNRNISSKTNNNILKNMKGMNDPAFQSNNTVKEYIDKKLSSILERNLNLIQKTRSFNIYKSSYYNLYANNKNLYYNIPIGIQPKIHQDNNISSSRIMNLSGEISKFKNKNNKSIKSKNITTSKYGNKSYSNQKYKVKENSLCLSINENPKVKKFKSNLINYNTPINVVKKEIRTTPIDPNNKTKSIYKSKKIGKKVIGISFQEKNKKYNNDNINPKISIFSNSFQQMNLLKNDLSNIKDKKTVYNLLDFNKSYFREDSKIAEGTKNNIGIRKINYIKHNKILSEKNNNNTRNRVVSFKYKLNDILNDDGSFYENECPMPMPYVKKYSDKIHIEEKKINEIHNIKNLFREKDLIEPKEEKGIPSPISKSISLKYFKKKIKKDYL